MANISALTAASIKVANFWPITAGVTIASVTTQTATTYEVVLSNGFSLRYIGSGFAYAGSPALPTAGTYDSIEYLNAGLTVLARLSGASGALNAILTGNPSVAVLAGDDVLTGGAGNDVLSGGAGNDILTDLSGIVTTLDGGLGDDFLRVDFNSFASGMVRGGGGQDTLQAMNDISGLSITGVETLITNSFSPTATAAQLAGFGQILQQVGITTLGVTLTMAATGSATTLDLTNALAFVGGGRAVKLTASSDAEAITTGSGADTVLGGTGNDSLFGGLGADSLQGDNGDDSLFGGDGDDVLAGHDPLGGPDGNDAVFGGNGNDTLSDFTGSATTLDGGLGNDFIGVNAVSFTSGVIAGGEGQDTLQALNDISGLSISGVETLFTNGFGPKATAAQFEGFDSIRVSNIPSALDDQVVLTIAAVGTDTALDLAGELNADGGRSVSLTGSSDNEMLTTGDAADVINGGDGNDTIDGGLGDDVINGGAGVNTVSYASASGSVNVLLGFAVSGANGGDSLTNIQNVIGSAFDDVIRGTTGDNRLEGGAGNDSLIDLIGTAATLDGGAGNDFIQTTATSGTIAGGDGQDTLFADVISGLNVSGVETLFTFDGNIIGTAAQFDAFDLIQRSNDDRVSFVNLQLSATGSAVTLDLTDELTFVGGVRGVSIIGSADNETFTTGSAGDFINTGFGNNTVNAGDGSDQINAGDGTDLLRGEGGNDNLNADAFGANPFTSRDTLFGGDGNDTLTDGFGASTNLDGGAGNDSILSSVLSGTVEGGIGEDTLFATGNLTGLSINGVETLFVADFTPTATVAQFEAFDHILRNDGEVFSIVSLRLAATGLVTTLDLKDELAFTGGVRSLSVNGSSDNETFTMGSAADFVDTGFGNNTVNAGDGNDQVNAGDGTDLLRGEGGNDNLNADAFGANPFTSRDTLFGGDGNDTLTDGFGASTLLDGGAGNDSILSSVLSGTVEGGIGEDTLFATGNLTGLSINGVETLFVADFSPTATAAQFEAFDHILRNDGEVFSIVSLQLAATGAVTTLDLTDELAFTGGARAVSINGSSDSENLTTGSGADAVFGGGGDDTVNAGLGNDQMFGGTGVNTVSYAGLTGNLTIDLSGFANGGAEGSDTFTNFQNAIGGAGNDAINGTNVANRLEGGAGNDILTADRQNDNVGGSDTLLGGDGNDVIIDMYGAVTAISGGFGSDRVTIGFGPGLSGPASGVLDGGEDASGTDDDILILNINSNLASFTLSGFESLFVGSTTVTGRATDFTAFSRIAFNDLFPNNAITLTLLASGETASVDLAAALTAGAATKATILGSADDEAIFSGSGNDSLSGGDGADTLSGGTGNDALAGNAGLDTYRFGAFGFGSDTVAGFITATAAPDAHEIIDLSGLGLTFADLSFAVAGGATTITIAGHVGDSIVLQGVSGGLTAEDFIFVGPGSRDFIGNAAGNVADADASVLTGFTGGTLADLKDSFGDHFFANNGPDSVQAGAGDDTIEGGTGPDTLRGGDGNDNISGGLGADLLDGGAGVNMLNYSGATVGVSVSLFAGTASAGAGADTLSGFANITGSNFDDTLVGDALANLLLGGAGNDVLGGGGADDTLRGGAGDDRLIDTTPGLADIEGGTGNDVIIISNGQTGSISGGEGNDALVASGTTVSLGGLVVSRLEELRSNAGTILGTAAQFEGFTLIRQDDNAANDGLRVTLNLIASGGDVLLDLADELNAGSTSRGVSLTGTDDGETLTTGAGADLVLAGAGNDVISSGAGNDQLRGGLGDDRLLGGANDDGLNGEEGADTLLGGDGNDRMIDRIGDAVSVNGGLGDDVLVLNGAGTATGSYAGGNGNDTLQITGTLTGLVLSSVEVLETATGQVTAFAAQLAPLTKLWRGEALNDGLVSVVLAASGSATTLDLSAALQSGGTRAIRLTGSADSETLTTGAGNDTIVDTVGASVAITSGLGDDEIFIGSDALGAVNGGDGLDILRAAGNISALALSNLEILQTGGNTVTGTAAQFEGFDIIRTAEFATSNTVSLILKDTGGPNVLDLTDELTAGGGPRAVALFGTSASDTLTTGAGADTVVAGLGVNFVTTGEGNDSIQSIGQDQIKAGGGDDIIDIRSGPSPVLILNGGIGTDTLVTSGKDLRGATLLSIEVLHTSGGAMTATAAQFEQFDTIRFGGANTFEQAQSVTLTVIGRGPASITRLDLVQELNSGGAPRGVLLTGSTDSEEFTTGDGNDTINGNGGVDTIRAGLGDDSIVLRAGRQTNAFGDDGNDVFTIQATQLGSTGASGELVGGLGADTLVADGRSILNLTSIIGVETLHTGLDGTFGSAANFEVFDTIARSATDLTGTVELRLSRIIAAYVLDLVDELSSGGLRGVHLKANEQTVMGGGTIRTTDGNDRIEAGDGADVIGTAGGDDTIIDAAGATTTIDAGQGNDVINLAGSAFGGGLVDGGLGSNTLNASGADLSALTLVNLQVLETGTGLRALASQLEGFDRIAAGTLAPDAVVRLTLVATGAPGVLDLSSELNLGGTRSALLLGSADSETLVLGAGNDSVSGGAGGDNISGGVGADVLVGRAGADTLLGGAQDDILCGGALADRLTGGGGADRFVFVEHRLVDADVVTDFTKGQDKIVVGRDNFGNFDTQGGVPVLPSAWFRANASGNAADGSDRFVYNTSTGKLFFDADGVGGIDKVLIATFTGNPLLGTTDFEVQTTISFGF